MSKPATESVANQNWLLLTIFMFVIGTASRHL